MHTVAIRPGLTIAYADDCFARAVAGARDRAARAWQLGILARLDPVGAVSRRPLSGDPHRHAGLRFLHGARWATSGARARLPPTSPVSLMRSQVERCHLIGKKYGGSIALQLASDPAAAVSPPCASSAHRRAASAPAMPTRSAPRACGNGRPRPCAPGSARPPRRRSLPWWTELMGATDQRAAFGSSSALVSMNLDDRLPLIKAPTLIVTTQESGLQTVEAVQQFAARIPDAQPDRARWRQLSHRRGRAGCCARGTRWSSSRRCRRAREQPP